MTIILHMVQQSLIGQAYSFEQGSPSAPARITLPDERVVHLSSQTASCVKDLFLPEDGRPVNDEGLAQMIAAFSSPLLTEHGLPDPTKGPLDVEDEEARVMVFSHTCLRVLYRELLKLRIPPHAAERILHELQVPLIRPSHDLQWDVPGNAHHLPSMLEWMARNRRVNMPLPSVHIHNFWDTPDGIRYATEFALSLIFVDPNLLRTETSIEGAGNVVRFPDAVFPDPKDPDHLRTVPLPPQRISA